jgi:hypothetical protein
MEQGKAQQLVVVATFVTMGSTTGAALRGTEKLPDTKIIVGGFFAMLGCSLLTEFDTRLGLGLATAIAGTAFITYGLPTLEDYFGNTKGKRSKTSAKG